jgi:hypothetical protein
MGKYIIYNTRLMFLLCQDNLFNSLNSSMGTAGIVVSESQEYETGRPRQLQARSSASPPKSIVVPLSLLKTGSRASGVPGGGDPRGLSDPAGEELTGGDEGAGLCCLVPPS